jgi:hypothetical protein
MTYKQEFCVTATSEQIKEQIQKYEKLWEEASNKRGAAIWAQNDSEIQEYSRLTLRYERTLLDLKADLTVKLKEEEQHQKTESEHYDAKQRLQKLLRDLQEIIQIL